MEIASRGRLKALMGHNISQNGRGFKAVLQNGFILLGGGGVSR